LSASTLARVCTSGRCGGTGIFCLQNNFFPRPDPSNWLRLAAAPDPVPQRAGYLSASCDGTQGNNGLGAPCSLTRPKTKGYGETCWCFVHSSAVWCTPHTGEHLTQSERTIANQPRYRRQRLVLFTSFSLQIKIAIQLSETS
jgi:hypothetical protein